MASTTTPLYTLSEGQPYSDPTTAQHFGGKNVKGLLLLQDTQLIETLAHFSRERIPERVVHARAAGAWGEFEVTHDVSQYTSAAFLNGIGKKSKVLLRVSTVGPEAGASDTVRDVRGWGMKIFTEEGNQDFVCNSIPVFFVRDPIKFPSLNRSHKRHPASHLPDASMFWDFHNNNPEGIHALMLLFSDRGTPKSVRHVNAYTGHTYKFTKEDGSFVYVKIHLKSNQTNATLSAAEAERLAGADPDAHIRDLYTSIQTGNYPSWNMYIQVMTPEQAETYRWNIFDMTKVWPHADFPLLPVGKLTINRNPANHFADIEQAAFSPSNIVPGIAPSADPMLQARMFAYPDAARYRLGPNYQFLPCNAPVVPVYAPYQRDGLMNFTANYGGDPNYVRSTQRPVSFKTGAAAADGFFQSTVQQQQQQQQQHDEWVGGRVSAFTSQISDEDFAQPAAFWKMLGSQAGQQEALVGNVAGHLGQADPKVREVAYGWFKKVDPELATRIEDEINKRVKQQDIPN